MLNRIRPEVNKGSRRRSLICLLKFLYDLVSFWLLDGGTSRRTADEQDARDPTETEKQDMKCPAFISTRFSAGDDPVSPLVFRLIQGVVCRFQDFL